MRSQAPCYGMSSFDIPDAESRGDGFLAGQDTRLGWESRLSIPPRVRMRCFRDVTTHPAGQGAYILALPMTPSGVRARVIYLREHEWRCSRERSTDPHIKQLNDRSCPSEPLQPGGVSSHAANVRRTSASIRTFGPLPAGMNADLSYRNPNRDWGIEIMHGDRKL